MGAAIADRQFARALLIALHLNESGPIVAALEAAPRDALGLIASVVPLAFLQRALELVAARLEPGSAGSPHIEFFLQWALALLQAHGRALKERSALFGGALRSLQRSFLAHRESIGRLAEANSFALDFLCAGTALLRGGGGGGPGRAAAPTATTTAVTLIVEDEGDD